MRVLVDADVMAYSCGFAAQKTVYFEEGVPDIVAEPVENALSLVKSALNGIYAEIDEWMLQTGERVEYLELFLTGKDNFRDKLATIRPYKGNRLNKPKPVHYKAIRDYMVNHWSAEIVDGHEADDEVSIQSASLGYDPDEVMICSVDKDLKTVPGYLYSFKKKEGFLISEQEALVNFYRQCITGDTSDNIVGCWKAGEKVAASIREYMEPSGMWEYVLDQYALSASKKGCPYSDYEAAALENARLLHMLRTPNEIWGPP